MIYNNITVFNNELKQDAKLLGLDVGKMRIGYSISDSMRVLAFGQGIINLKKNKISKEFFPNLITEHKICGIVIGYPLQMDGEVGDACKMVDQFIQKYLASLAMPLFLQDERLSSSAVSRMFREMNISRKKQADFTDEAAASYILQFVLDRLLAL